MLLRTLMLTVVVCLATAGAAGAQSTPTPLYRVFLEDGTALGSYGEWARVDDRVIFSMPLAPDATASDLHLVSLPVERVDLVRTERYAETIRATHYAANRGEADFAQLSGDVAHALNQVALIPDAAARLAAAERARRSLTDWPGAHYGYRAAEVQEIIGVLDGVISGLRASAGLGRFDLALTATTGAVPSSEPVIENPGHAQVVEHLMTASRLVTSPAERVSLLQSAIALLDRAVGLLPDALATTFRTKALDGIAEEQRLDDVYARLRTVALSDATRLAERADVRGLERLRTRVRAEDQSLGARRPDEVEAVLATLDVHLDSAHRVRLAYDQWLLRVDSLRAYKRASLPFVQTLNAAQRSLDDIRLMAGPTPERLRTLARRLSRAARRLALVEPSPEVAGIHAVFRSAYELAESAVLLRLDAAAAADVDLARQASSAASGALMLFARARADLDTAIRPPIATRLLSSP